MAVAGPELPKGMQFRRPGLAEEPVPGIRSESRDTSEAGIDVAKLHRANQPGEVAAKRAHGGITLRLRLHGDHQKNRRAREWCEHRLRKRNLIRVVEHRHPACLVLLRF